MKPTGTRSKASPYGYSGVKQLNAQVATLSPPTCAPVIAVARLRRGNIVSRYGGAKLVVFICAP